MTPGTLSVVSPLLLLCKYIFHMFQFCVLKMIYMIEFSVFNLHIVQGYMFFFINLVSKAIWQAGAEVVAVHKFSGNTPEDLPFKRGDILTIVRSTGVSLMCELLEGNLVIRVDTCDTHFICAAYMCMFYFCTSTSGFALVCVDHFYMFGTFVTSMWQKLNHCNCKTVFVQRVQCTSNLL